MGAAGLAGSCAAATEAATGSWFAAISDSVCDVLVVLSAGIANADSPVGVPLLAPMLLFSGSFFVSVEKALFIWLTADFNTSDAILPIPIDVKLAIIASIISINTAALFTSLFPESPPLKTSLAPLIAFSVKLGSLGSFGCVFATGAASGADSFFVLSCVIIITPKFIYYLVKVIIYVY